MLRRMSAKQFARWVWYEQVEPFGELRADWRTAQITSMIHNTVVKTENQKSIKDFLLEFRPSTESSNAAPPVRKQTVEEQVEILNILARAFSVAGVDA